MARVPPLDLGESVRLCGPDRSQGRRCELIGVAVEGLETFFGMRATAV